MGRRTLVLFCVVLVANWLPHVAAASDTDDRVLIRGVGAAHGFGMAMDGVLGQARAGWPADRILSLFYPGTSVGHAEGTIRVGLSTGNVQHLALPGGGTISDATGEAAPGSGFPQPIPEHGKVTVVFRDGRPELIDESPSGPQEQQSTHDPVGLRAANPLPTPPPVLPPEMPPDPEEPPDPDVEDPEPEAPEVSERTSLWIVGGGDPALVAVESTGRRYRGVIEVRAHAGSLVVVNHVGLEDYVAGIAEEKGQGWPVEGLKVLAVAARSLGAATMTWYTKNKPNGYDICPTANCQVYLGYDGEEPAMREATLSTAGQIRTWNGSPIMAMYHGNGGGQTESYRRVARTSGDPHPYLTSVRYPHANPSRWEAETTLTRIGAALAARDISLAGPIQAIDIVERGDSPRVIRLAITAGDQNREIAGTTFAGALDLRSTWFDIVREDATPVLWTGTGRRAGAERLQPAPAERKESRTLLVALPALLAVGAAALRTTLLRPRRGARPETSTPHA